MSEEYGGDFIVLTDDEGHEVELEHLDTLEYEGNTFMALVPVTENEEEEELVILMVEEEDGEEILVTVDDEQLLEAVYEIFMQRVEDMEESE